MMQEGEEEPNPQRDVLTPGMESTPVEGREKGRCSTGFRALTAPKKMWVQPESVVKQEEDGEKSSYEESSTSRRSPLSAISSGRRVPEKEEAGPTRVCIPLAPPTRRYVVGPPRCMSGSTQEPGWGRSSMQTKESKC